MQPNILSDRRRDILLLTFSIVSILVLVGRGIYLIITGLNSYESASMTAQTSSFFDIVGMFFCTGLLLPLPFYCIRKLKGREIRPAKVPPVKFWQVAVVMVIWVFIIILGSILNNLPNYARFMALPFFMLGIALPVAGLVWIAIGGIPIGSIRRVWAAFGIGMTGSTVGAMLLEYSLVGVTAVAIGIVAASNPEWRAVFQQIKSQITSGGDLQGILSTLAPYLTNPLVLLLALVFAAFVAPVIEESLKPAAIWLLGKRLRSPAEGFALGALCGAGFALLEGTLAASGSPQMLGVGIAARATSSLMHITASGVMGWGIASARLENRYDRLARAFLLSIFIHGMWNGSVVLAVFGALRLSLPGADSDLLGILLVLMGIGMLGSMLVTITILLPIFNHRLRHTPPAAGVPSQSDIIAPLQS
jgi:RsiW-degrading membrane proteinase PrsW (M82 family)